MKFKVGDMVRPTRDFLISWIEEIDSWEIDWGSPEYVEGFQVIKIENNFVYYEDSEIGFYLESNLELVPEEPEFKYWEEIEVGDDDWRREKRIFLLKIPWNVIDPYVVVEWGSNERFQFGESYDVEVWRFARKPRSSLTRKEIAEKFWVSEDFVLVD